MVLNFEGFIWKVKRIITNKLAQPKHSQSRPATDINGTKTRVYNFVFFEVSFSFIILFYTMPQDDAFAVKVSSLQDVPPSNLH